MYAHEGGYGLVPFHYPTNDSVQFAAKVRALRQTVRELRQQGLVVYVILDGVKAEVPEADQVIFLTEHSGKAAAVRAGLVALMRQKDCRVIVQCDADLDQNPGDARWLLAKFHNKTVALNGQPLPMLIIGDRYPEVNWLRIFTKAPKTPIYRRFVLWVSKVICGQCGLNARDAVSGLRLYNREYAEQFLRLSQSQNYGLEMEMIVIAYLIGAVVDSQKLSYSRPRDPHTAKEKIAQNFMAILRHRREIIDQGGIFNYLIMKIFQWLEHKLSKPHKVKTTAGYVAPLALVCSIWSIMEFLSYLWGGIFDSSYRSYKQQLVWDYSPLGIGWMRLQLCMTTIMTLSLLTEIVIWWKIMPPAAIAKTSPEFALQLAKGLLTFMAI